MKLLGVSSVYVSAIWNKVAPILAPAVKQNKGFSMEDVYEALKSRDMQLWLADDGKEIKGAGVTQILTYPRKRTCLLLFTAGVDWASWRHLLSDIEEWATKMGCDDFEFIGRRGWQKKGLEGYQPTSVVYNKPLRG